MKAVKVVKPFEVEVIEVAKPVIENKSDVLIRITSGGICGSDMQIYNGTNSLATYPRIIGHEFGGVVEEIGADVKNICVGDKVCVNPVISCNNCYACGVGRGNVCSSLEVMGVHRDGGFAEYICVPEQNVHKFSSDFDESLLCLVEPYTIGMQINNRARIKKDDMVLIIGCGPIGIGIMQIAKMRGATVIMADLVKERLIRAKDMGADEVILSSEEDIEQRVKQITNNEGMPVVIDAVCIPQTFELSVKLASAAGRVVVIGLKALSSNIVMADITKKELDIIGSRLSNNCFDSVVECFEKGLLQPEKMKTAQFHFTEIQKAIDLVQSSPESILKVTLAFN